MMKGSAALLVGRQTMDGALVRWGRLERMVGR